MSGLIATYESDYVCHLQAANKSPAGSKHTIAAGSLSLSLSLSLGQKYFHLAGWSTLSRTKYDVIK